MIPADLLSALREKDPELWERYKQWSAHMDIYDETALQYILQGELQEAIRARGWSYRLIWASSVICKAFICTGPGIHESVNCDTEADALCRAYLAAIQEAA